MTTQTPPPVAVLCCSTKGCPEIGKPLNVDLAALRFAQQEQDQVRCGSCRRPLIRYPGTAPRRP